jgi:hypothetical protein
MPKKKQIKEINLTMKNKLNDRKFEKIVVIEIIVNTKRKMDL